MSINVTNCQCCNLEITTTNRLMTESCGHRKCRRCVLAEESGCLECKKEASEKQSVEKESDETRNTKIPTTLIPAHIQQIKNANGKQTYLCKNCGRTFRSRTQQYYHLGCGNEQAKRYICTQNDCTKRFSTRAHLSYHLETHRPGNYACKDCAKVFKHSVLLHKHERVNHHRAPTNKIQKQNVQTKRIHKCDVCQRSYLTKSTLHQHMLTHFEKKYKCNICNKLYLRQTVLRMHMQRHNKIQKYACRDCHKCFSDVDSLTRHTKQHQPVQTFNCKLCDISTSRKDNMLRHVRNMHQNEQFENCVEIINHKQTIKSPSSETSILPKTVENSSVIKCIGNVQPVKICNAETTKALNDSESVKPIKEAKYDPIKYYLKILNPDDESASELDASSQDAIEKQQKETTNLSDANTVMEEADTATQPQPQQQRSNFSEMHWRKNFKYAYEYKNSDY